MKKTILDKKKTTMKLFFAAVVMIGAIISIIATGCSIVQANSAPAPHVEQAVAETTLDATTDEGYSYSHDAVKDIPEKQYNFTVDFWEAGAKDSDNPVQWIKENALALMDHEKTQSPDPLFSATTIATAQAKTNENLTGQEIREDFLVTDENNLHQSFRENYQQ